MRDSEIKTLSPIKGASGSGEKIKPEGPEEPEELPAVSRNAPDVPRTLMGIPHLDKNAADDQDQPQEGKRRDVLPQKDTAEDQTDEGRQVA